MWIKSIRNCNYLTWPLLAIWNVNSHFPESQETQKGHMWNQYQGLRSTKAKSPHPGTYEAKGAMYTYQTGKFPHMSIRGNRYQMIFHEIDGNCTCIEPMKNKTEGEMILARRRALEWMKVQGILPTYQVLENEIYIAYRLEIKQTSMNYQLVPPDNHRRNLADKLIQTWKDHFIGVTSGTLESFPAHIWCQAIPQAKRQLLLLQQSNVNPKISAYTYVYGPHN